MFKKLITISLFLIIGLTAVQYAQAQRGIDPALKPINLPDTQKTGLEEAECINKYGAEAWDKNSQMCLGHEDEPITAFLQVLGGALLMLAGGIAVIVIAYGGLQYVLSHGNQEKIEKAKKTLLYGIIGALVVIFSYFIVELVLQIIIGV